MEIIEQFKVGCKVKAMSSKDNNIHKGKIV